MLIFQCFDFHSPFPLQNCQSCISFRGVLHPYPHPHATPVLPVSLSSCAFSFLSALVFFKSQTFGDCVSCLFFQSLEASCTRHIPLLQSDPLSPASQAFVGEPWFQPLQDPLACPAAQTPLGLSRPSAPPTFSYMHRKEQGTNRGQTGRDSEEASLNG